MHQYFLKINLIRAGAPYQNLYIWFFWWKYNINTNSTYNWDYKRQNPKIYHQDEAELEISFLHPRQNIDVTVQSVARYRLKRVVLTAVLGCL